MPAKRLLARSRMMTLSASPEFEPPERTRGGLPEMERFIGGVGAGVGAGRVRIPSTGSEVAPRAPGGR